MSMFSVFQKIGGLVSGAKKAANIVGDVVEAAEILNRDEDHNGKPDLQDKMELLLAILVKAGKNHIEQLKKEFAEVKALALTIKAQLDEVRAGVK